MKLPVLSWLLPSDLSPDDRALIVQTGSSHLLVKLVDALREQHPSLQLTVLLQKRVRKTVPLREGVEYLDNPGPKPGFVHQLRQRRFDRVYVLFSNEPGFWKLKLLPFLVGARGVFAVNENLDSFPVDLRHSEQLASHARWRMESSVSFASEVELDAVWSAAKAVAYPAVLAWLAGYERLRGSKAEGRARSWKDENRPHGDGA